MQQKKKKAPKMGKNINLVQKWKIDKNVCKQNIFFKRRTRFGTLLKS